MKINRRELVKRSLIVSGAVALGPAGRFGNALLGEEAQTTLPNPASSGIKHIVVVTMENRSLDHLLGWLPNVNGKQGGLTYVDAAGVSHQTYSLSGDYTGCPHPDPDHSYDGARIQYDGARMDGFLKDTSNDVYSIGYYSEQDIPFYGALARNYTTCDRYFPSILGPTFPNRLFLHAAQTDRLSNTASPATMPTIWDRLIAANISARYYYSNVPFLGLWGPKYLGISALYAEFILAAQSGTLPAVSFVDPIYTILDDGTGNDDHPHADIRKGDRFLYDTFQAVATGPNWASTVFIVNFDEWGGFFEHIAPPRAIAPNQVDPDLVNGKALLGFRVPTVVASPFSKGAGASPRVSGQIYDHTSVLKLIEWRWGLAPLTARDASNDVQNLAYALDFENPSSSVPNLPAPVAPVLGAPCPGSGGLLGIPSTPTVTDESAVWTQVGQYAAANGFTVSGL
jgi:phospholipase C